LTTTPQGPWGYLSEHAVNTAREMGWAELSNGNLLDRAEQEGYEIVITADQSMRHQQNLGRRGLAVIVLLSNRWPDVQPRIEDIRNAIDVIQPGEVREVPIPLRSET